MERDPPPERAWLDRPQTVRPAHGGDSRSASSRV